MKFLTQKRQFFSDSSITKNAQSALSKVIFILSFFLFSSNCPNIKASNIAEILQQKSTTKTTPKTSPATTKTTKVDKDKLKARLNKAKKKAVVKKDTLQDIDPANTGTPLYQNEN